MPGFRSLPDTAGIEANIKDRIVPNSTFMHQRPATSLGIVSLIVFRVTARKEAEFLLGEFGPVYSAYAQRTPRFWPNPFLFRDKAEWQFSTHALKRTFYDELYFLAVFPAIETVEHFRINGFLPTFFTLY